MPTEPAGYTGPQSTAEIAVHPSGKFLYASNRGHNSIAGFRIDPTSGLLSSIGHTTSGINFPRNFAIDPSGTWLYAANQKGDTIGVISAINRREGAFTETDVAVPLSDFKNGMSSVNVHRFESPYPVVACGDIPAE